MGRLDKLAAITMRNAFFIISFLSIVSCEEAAVKHEAEVTDVMVKNDSATTNKEIVPETLPNDSNFSGKLLTVGNFHEDEVSINDKNEKWFGLFNSENNYYVAPTRVLFDRVYDVVLDEEGQKTGWRIKTTNKDTSIILFSKLDFVRKGKVQIASLQKNQLLPGDSLAFGFLGINYRLYALGKMNKVKDVGVEQKITDYRLFLKVSGQPEELLVSKPNFDDQMITFLFAGDIDGDGRLDLLIDTSNHYNTFAPTLFLSKPATKGRTLKLVGQHISVGC